MRSMWNGTVAFGLVNIPVKMYLAAEESSLSFVQLDKKTRSRVKYKKVSEQTGKELQTEDIVKAYQLDNNYIIVDDADVRKAAPEKVDHIEISQFINEKEVDSVFFEKPYYLEPAQNGAKAYALLRDALTKEHKAALGQLVFQSKQWICLIKPLNKVLVLHRLRFSDEIRSTAGLAIPEMPVKAEELKMASMLITQLTKPFRAADLRDTYTEKLLKVIEAKAKAKGKDTGKPLKVVHNATTGDLMEKLRASLKAKPANKKAS